MTAFTKRKQIATYQPQFREVRYLFDVVDLFGSLDHSYRLAIGAPRESPEVKFSATLPRRIIATTSRRSTPATILLLGFLCAVCASQRFVQRSAGKAGTKGGGRHGQDV